MGLSGVIIGGAGGARSIRSRGTTYSEARAGSGTKTLRSVLTVGQAKPSGAYDVHQAGVGFALADLGYLVVDAAYLQCAPRMATGNRTIEAYRGDWGDALDPGDFIPGAELTGLTRLATLDLSGHGGYATVGQGGMGGSSGPYNNEGRAGYSGAVRITHLDGFTTWTTAGTYTWTCPAGITQAYVECWGGGGGGGDGQYLGEVGGGGGGGAYAASWVSVTPASDYQVIVGAAGAAGADGADSKFAATVVVADGGYKGAYGVGGEGGKVASSTGTTRTAGGMGTTIRDTSGMTLGGKAVPLPVRFTSNGDALRDVLLDRATRGEHLRLILAPEKQRLDTAPAGDDYSDLPAPDAWSLVLLHSGNRKIDDLFVTVERAPALASDSMTFAVEHEAWVTCHIRADVVRPRSDSVKTFDYQRQYVGILPGDVQTTAVLDGPDELRVDLPWAYMRSDGAFESRVGMIAAGWYLEHDGMWYRVTSFTRNPVGNRLQVKALSAEYDLDRYLTNYGQIPFSLAAHTPTEIATAFLSGRPECDWFNGDFARLDEDGFPLGWNGTQTADWRVYVEGGEHTLETTAAETALLSEGVRHTAGAEIRPLVDVYVGEEFHGRIRLVAYWQNAAGGTSHTDSTEVDSSEGRWHTFEVPEWWTVRNERCRLAVTVDDNESGAVVRVRRLRFRQKEAATGWTYQGTLDSRPGDIAYNDSLFVRYGGWTLDAGEEVIQSATDGDMLARPFTGDMLSVCFAAGGPEARADILIDGVLHAEGLDVSEARSYEIAGLNRYRPHLLEVIVRGGTVKVCGLVQSTENRIAVRWNRRPVYQALLDLQEQVGGEYEFNTRDQIIFHTERRGLDLTETNLLWLREGVNLGELSQSVDQTQPGNRCYGAGYGDEAFQLGIVVDADVTDDEGLTSQERFGVLRFGYTNKEARDLVTLAEDARREANARALRADTYNAVVEDTYAAHLHPGDTVRVTHTALGADGRPATKTLRVLQVVRSSSDQAAKVTFGVRPPVAVGTQYAALKRAVDRLTI